MNRQSFLPLFFIIGLSVLPIPHGYSEMGKAKSLLSKLKAELGEASIVKEVEKAKFNLTKAPVPITEESIDVTTTTVNNAPWRWNSTRRPDTAKVESKVLSGSAALEEPNARNRDAELHTVRSGETMSAIAQYYGQSEVNLRTLNGIFGSRTPVAGQVIKVKGRINAATSKKAYDLQPEARVIPKMPKGEDGFEVYAIRSGDNPSKIAQKFNVSSKDLMALNQIENPRLLKIGQKLRIPSKRLEVAPAFDSDGHDVYVVKTGDSLWTIAQNHGIEYYTFVGLNNITNPAGIKVGQKLKLPQKK